MWKTGKVAAEFKRDPKTIKRIVQEYPQYFTQDAREDTTGKRVHRTFHMSDLVVINSVLRWEFTGTTADRVRARLEAGEREEDIPPGFRVIEGDTAMAVYAEMSQLRTIIQQYELSDSKHEQQHAADREEIIKLNRKIAVLEYRLEQLEVDDEE